VRFTPGEVEVRGPQVHHYARVGAGARRPFTVMGRAPGTFLVMIAVPTGSTRAVQRGRSKIVRAAKGGGHAVGRVGMIGAALLVLAGVGPLLCRLAARPPRNWP
jgi:hypothetical protein